MRKFSPNSTRDAFALPISDARRLDVALSGVNVAIPVPPGARVVVFNATGHFFVNYDTDALQNELSPSARVITGVNTITVTPLEDITFSTAFFS